MKPVLHLGDCLEVMMGIPDASVDSIVTDPPYGLSFMNKHWDYDVPSVEVWAECLRVLKPGGHLLAFAGTRTQHRMAVRIEDAGFEIRDMIAWVYGSGFPKSADVSKQIGKAAGAAREVLGTVDPRGAFDGRERNSTAINTNWRGAEGRDDVRDLSKKQITAPATDAARQWQGWGTALKPALEPITVARKPLIGTVAANVLEFGTGALNIDGCRVPLNGDADAAEFANNHAVTERLPAHYDGQNLGLHEGGWKQRVGPAQVPEGRWPANLIHDGSEEVLRAFPDAPGQQGDLKGHNKDRQSPNGCFGKMAPARDHAARVEVDKSAARFFYCAKASKRDRGEGNNHPTVKPTDLMRYLCRLVAPPGGVVLDPFMGSGSTGKAAGLEGFDFIGIERDPTYFLIAAGRIQGATP